MKRRLQRFIDIQVYLTVKHINVKTLLCLTRMRQLKLLRFKSFILSDELLDSKLVLLQRLLIKTDLIHEVRQCSILVASILGFSLLDFQILRINLCGIL